MMLINASYRTPTVHPVVNHGRGFCTQTHPNPAYMPHPTQGPHGNPPIPPRSADTRGRWVGVRSSGPPAHGYPNNPLDDRHFEISGGPNGNGPRQPAHQDGGYSDPPGPNGFHQDQGHAQNASFGARVPGSYPRGRHRAGFGDAEGNDDSCNLGFLGVSDAAGTRQPAHQYSGNSNPPPPNGSQQGQGHPQNASFGARIPGSYPIGGEGVSVGEVFRGSNEDLRHIFETRGLATTARIADYEECAELSNIKGCRVVHARHRDADSTACDVVLKVFKLGNGDAASRAMRSFARFTSNAKLASHPLIVEIRSVFIDGENLVAEMPYYVGGDLAAWTETGASLPARMRVLAEVGRAIEHLHTLGIVHRDIKPHNVLMDSRDSTARPRLTDFDLSHFVDTGSTGSTTIAPRAGTFDYRAPELLGAMFDASAATSPAIDVFAFGVTVLYVLCGKVERANAVAVPKIPRDDDQLPPAYVALLERMLDPNPARRPSMRDVMCDDAFRGVADEPELHECFLCFGDVDVRVSGLRCTQYGSATCDRCVRSLLGEGRRMGDYSYLTEDRAGLRCPACLKAEHFPIHDVLPRLSSVSCEILLLMRDEAAAAANAEVEGSGVGDSLSPPETDGEVSGNHLQT